MVTPFTGYPSIFVNRLRVKALLILLKYTKKVTFFPTLIRWINYLIGGCKTCLLRNISKQKRQKKFVFTESNRKPGWLDNYLGFNNKNSPFHNYFFPFCIMIKFDVDVREFPAEDIDCPKCLHLCYNWGTVKWLFLPKKIYDRSCIFELRGENDHRSHALKQLENKANSSLSWIQNHYRCDIGVVLYQMSFQATWELVTL